ncbi:FG-GAP-like repeat-containing protein [Persicitalea jodogahamensis]|uniref:Secretion system C-terminal sorting domain-containing protein n=1 Tax=Persicitalea jodogahamensis TaxID=402147 RepID=A0A8J3G794_9BACT|nr:FG-GAP-like repeat-containing protein [Persicitalea jodogahamensis]GHB53785.1 hypothetical protein GCM10007390_03330 [Persicitalea jodogahamensis]
MKTTTTDASFTRLAPISLLLVLSGGAWAQGFGPKTDYPAGSYPRSVAVGDFNADGKPDLATANISSNNTVSVLLGDGAGGFLPSTDYPTGISPFSVAVGDFNADGKPDLATANISGNNTVSVLLSDGAGGFLARTDYPTGSYPVSVAVGDFNADGKPDLAVANSNNNTVSVLLSDGAGGFLPRTDYPTDLNPNSVAVGDFNADGKPDLAVANSNNNTVSVLLGDGAGGFLARTDYPTGTYPYSVAVGDFNGDGKPDLATANPGNNTVSVLLNACPSITLTPTVSDVRCQGGSDGSIALTPGGGTAPYTYSVDGGASYGGLSTLSGLSAGAYSVRVKDANDCVSAAQPVTIGEPATTLSASVSGNGGSICAGGTASFTVSGSSGATLTYTITGQSGSQTLPLNGSSQTITASGATSNVALTLVSVSLNGCTQNLSGSSTVTVKPLPTASISGNGGSVCAGSDASFTVSGTSGATLTYTITGQNGSQTLLLDGTSQTITASGATSNVTLTLVSVSKEGCTQNLSGNSTVTVKPQPTASIGGNGGAVCAGSNASFTVSGTSGATLTYTITGQNGSQTLLLNGSSQTITASNATANVALTLVSVSLDGCTQNLSGSSTVTVKPQPTASISGNGGAICSGGTASFTVSGTSGSTLTYTITGQVGSQTLLLDGSSQTLTASNATANVALTLVSVSLNGCTQNLSGSSTVTVNPLPTLTPGPDQSVVLGFGSNCTELTATASGGSGSNYVYNWTPGNLKGPTVTVCPETTTTYSVTVTDGKGCTSLPAQVTVSVQDVRCGNKNQNVTICYYGVTQCVSEKIATRYLKLGATLGGCGSSVARIGVQETTDLPLTLSLKAYPNPVQDAVTVQVLSPTAGEGTLEVLDLAGRSWHTQSRELAEGLNEIELRLDSLPTGLYLVRLRDAAGRQAAVRMKKQ